MRASYQELRKRLVATSNGANALRRQIEIVWEAEKKAAEERRRLNLMLQKERSC